MKFRHLALLVTLSFLAVASLTPLAARSPEGQDLEIIRIMRTSFGINEDLRKNDVADGNILMALRGKESRAHRLRQMVEAIDAVDKIAGLEFPEQDLTLYDKALLDGVDILTGLATGALGSYLASLAGPVAELIGSAKDNLGRMKQIRDTWVVPQVKQEIYWQYKKMRIEGASEDEAFIAAMDKFGGNFLKTHDADAAARKDELKRRFATWFQLDGLLGKIARIKRERNEIVRAIMAEADNNNALQDIKDEAIKIRLAQDVPPGVATLDAQGRITEPPADTGPYVPGKGGLGNMMKSPSVSSGH
ncbi:MAG: hypothetical protein GX442_18305 [Candidatus Riflebacteria bacterium]|nr:hypothetical protein [Candidatus Riflebacteria bacterium]